MRSDLGNDSVESILWNVLYNESVDVIFVTDTSLQILHFNGLAAARFGFVEHASLQDFFSTESCLNLANLIQSGFVGRCMVQLIDDRQMTQSLLATLVSEKVVLQLLTLESKHPIRSQQHTLSLGRFLGNIAHAISNPLSVLQGRIELLLHKSAQYPPKLKRYLVAMSEQSNRIAGQLHLVQILAKLRNVSPKPMLIEEGICRFIEKNPDDLILETSTLKEAQVVFQHVHIDVLLLNLISVLREKIPCNKIYIQAECNDMDVHISIATKSSTNDSILLTLGQEGIIRNQKGVDIRLLLCGLLLESYDSSLFFSNQNNDFRAILRIPMWKQVERSLISSALRILVIDDHSNLRETLSALLSKEGHQIASVPSAEDALTLISTSEFDIVVSDIRLSGMSGLELYDFMMDANPKMAKRMILISGIHQQLERNTIPFLRKPFSKDDLLSVIQTIL